MSVDAVDVNAAVDATSCLQMQPFCVGVPARDGPHVVEEQGVVDVVGTILIAPILCYSPFVRLCREVEKHGALDEMCTTLIAPQSDWCLLVYACTSKKYAGEDWLTA